jgi:hypothetical protein
MDLIKKYKVVIAVVLPIFILVLIKQFGGIHFKNDAKRWAEPSMLRSNILSGELIRTLAGEKLIINLDNENGGTDDKTKEFLSIPADSILNNLRIIRQHDGPVLLVSSDYAISARIWMVLSQMGLRNIYILTNDADNEVFKSKFRPDTLVRPEL